MKMNNKVLRQKIHEVFGTIQERFRNTKPTIALIDALAITNQGYGYIMNDLDKQEKELREIRKKRFDSNPLPWEREAVKLIKEILGEQHE